MKQIISSRSKKKNTSQLSFALLIAAPHTLSYPLAPKASNVLFISNSHYFPCPKCTTDNTTVLISGKRAKPDNAHLINLGDVRTAKRKNKRKELSKKLLAYAEKLSW